MSGDITDIGSLEVDEYDRLVSAYTNAVREREELRAALGIPETATHNEAVERARQIAYEAETLRLIEDNAFAVRCESDLWVPERDHYWVVYPPIKRFKPERNLHAAVRAAAGKGES